MTTTDTVKQLETIDDIMDLIADDHSVDQIRYVTLNSDTLHVHLYAGAMRCGEGVLTVQQFDELKKIVSGLLDIIELACEPV